MRRPANPGFQQERNRCAQQGRNVADTGGSGFERSCQDNGFWSWDGDSVAPLSQPSSKFLQSSSARLLSNARPGGWLVRVGSSLHGAGSLSSYRSSTRPLAACHRHGSSTSSCDSISSHTTSVSGIPLSNWFLHGHGGRRRRGRSPEQLRTGELSQTLTRSETSIEPRAHRESLAGFSRHRTARQGAALSEGVWKGRKGRKSCRDASFRVECGGT